MAPLESGCATLQSSSQQREKCPERTDIDWREHESGLFRLQTDPQMTGKLPGMAPPHALTSWRRVGAMNKAVIRQFTAVANGRRPSPSFESGANGVEGRSRGNEERVPVSAPEYQLNGPLRDLDPINQFSRIAVHLDLTCSHIAVP